MVSMSDSVLGWLLRQYNRWTKSIIAGSVTFQPLKLRPIR